MQRHKRAVIVIKSNKMNFESASSNTNITSKVKKEEDPPTGIKMYKAQSGTISKSKANLHCHASSNNFTNDKEMSVFVKQGVVQVFKPEINLNEVSGNAQ